MRLLQVQLQEVAQEWKWSWPRGSPAVLLGQRGGEQVGQQEAQQRHQQGGGGEGVREKLQSPHGPSEGAEGSEGCCLCAGCL